MLLCHIKYDGDSTTLCGSTELELSSQVFQHFSSIIAGAQSTSYCDYGAQGRVNSKLLSQINRQFFDCAIQELLGTGTSTSTATGRSSCALTMSIFDAKYQRQVLGHICYKFMRM